MHVYWQDSALVSDVERGWVCVLSWVPKGIQERMRQFLAEVLSEMISEP